MKIGIDCRLWGQTGVGRYVRNLVENLAEIDDKNEYVLFVRSEDEDGVKSEIRNLKFEKSFKITIADVKWHSAAEQFKFPKILNVERLDLMHFTYFSIPMFYKGPFVVTVHDLIVNNFSTGRASTLPYPIFFAKKLGYLAVMSRAIHNARTIIVPSEAVRTNVIRTYRNLDGSKIKVTYEGGFGENIKDQKSNIKNQELGNRYILRVGNFYPHKNVERLLAAFRDLLLQDAGENLKLVMVGKKDFFHARIQNEIKALNIESSVMLLENVEDDELHSLYKHAAATVIPSLAEGFSLTAVEAMSAGSLVVASDIPVHREVCGEAALYFNPEDTNEITQKLNFALSLTQSSKKEFLEAAQKQSQKFSWRKMADETLKVYESV